MSIFNKGSSQWVPRYNGIQIQSASSAIPIPIVYGTNRIAPNILWTGGFRSYPQRSGGGKGGGQVTGYDYQTDMVIGLCEGPIWSFGTVWNGNDIVPINGNGLYFGTAYVGTTQNDGFTDFQEGGLRNDTFWSNEGVLGSQALYYPGIAYLCSSDLDLGTSGTMPSLAFEIYAIKQGTAFVPSGGIPQYGVQDADPARCIYDILTNAQYGVGFPAVSIDQTTLYAQSSSDSSYQNYCFATGFSLSPALVDQEAANSILARWLQLTNSTAIWSGGVLKFIPYGDSIATGNSGLSVTSREQFTGGQGTFSTVTFIPHCFSSSGTLEPVANLGPDDFVNDSDADPVICIRSNPYTAYNTQSVIALNRAYYYTPTTIAAFDQNAIDAYGLRIGSSISANEICNLSVAQISAQLILQRGLYIRNTYQFKLSFEYCLIDPMDIVTLYEPLIGLNHTPVRITSIEEDDAGLLSFTAEEFPEGVGTAAINNVQAGIATINSVRYAIPSPINPPIIFEPPASLTGGSPEVWAAISGGIQPVYSITEGSSAGTHSATWTAPPSSTGGTSGDTATFTVYVLVPASNSKTTVSIIGFDGTNSSQIDFLLTEAGQSAPNGTVFFTSTSISPIVAGSLTYYQLTVALPLRSGTISTPFTATFQLCLSNSASLPSVISYTGTGVDCVYIWGSELSILDDAAPSMVNIIPSLLGATYAANTSILTPLGTQGTYDPNWGGCNIFVSTDNLHYSNIGTITGASRQGSLSASILSTDTSLNVSLLESNGSLSSGSPIDAEAGLTLCILDDELLSYTTATQSSPPTWALTGLNRGLYGTAAAAHSANAPFARIDSNCFSYALPNSLLGVTLYFKLQSFNLYGGCTQDISECQVYTYTPAGSSVVGAVLSSLAAGTSVDLGLVSESVSESDTCGLVSDFYVANDISLGNI